MKLLTNFALIIVLSITCYTATAQHSEVKNALAYRIIAPWEGFDRDSDITDFGAYDIGAEIAFSHHFNNYFGLEIPLMLGIADLDKPNLGQISHNELFAGLSTLGRLQYLKSPDQRFVPWINGGLNFEYSEVQDLRVSVPGGIGLDLKVAKNVYLTGGASYRLGFNTENERLTLKGGLKVLLGEKGEKEEEMPKEPTDTDNDGISDDMDECPNEIGTADLNGCPDSDNDGVKDTEDKCPNIAGLANMNGCPDNDGDGIVDADDKCPNEPGVPENNGCPVVVDSDGDGIADADDKCPNAKGTAQTNGCPDADGDGVADASDKCPNDKGSAKTGGCPDSDNDGVANIDDKCPELAGDAANKGCPTIKKEEKEVLTFAMRAVEFETGSARLKSSSFEVLDQISGIMAKYPNYRLFISGYTDSTGSSATNQRLSENRARSCYSYLTKKGVSSQRITYVGYGEESPIADNNTAAGRQKNRRVEFDLKPE